MPTLIIQILGSRRGCHCVQMTRLIKNTFEVFDPSCRLLTVRGKYATLTISDDCRAFLTCSAQSLGYLVMPNHIKFEKFICHACTSLESMSHSHPRGSHSGYLQFHSLGLFALNLTHLKFLIFFLRFLLYLDYSNGDCLDFCYIFVSELLLAILSLNYPFCFDMLSTGFDGFGTCYQSIVPRFPECQ